MQKQYYRVLIVILACAAVIVAASLYFAHEAQPPASSSGTPTTGASSTPDTSGWTAYANARYGFSIKYPPHWQKSNDPMNTVTPYVFFGNPLNGTTTYTMKLFAYNNPGRLSAEDFVAQMLASDTAEDASNSASGPAPQMTPHFASQFATTVNGYPAYELDGVFEYDHNAEEVYVADGNAMLIFDFPVADENPNIASASENNAVAHEILGTLTLSSS